MRIIVSLIILGLALFSTSADAQPRNRKKSAKNKTVKKIPKTISAGVVNGRAINLVRPEYPQSARMMNVYGFVNVQILIDETGSVVSAEAVSGHPLLRSASVKAALESRFYPITLSGEPVRVNGIIIYHFIPNEWNWLEIGYAIHGNSSYYTIKRLFDLFPTGYSDERQLLKQYLAENEPDEVFLQTVITSIQGKLSSNEKDLWLFSVGIVLGKVNRCCWNDLQKQDLVQQINFLIISKPENAKSALISLLEKVISRLENPNVKIYNAPIYPLLNDSENKFPFWGR